MTAPRPTTGLPGLAVQVVPAGTVEPGELLLSPALPDPTRVWWRLDGPGVTTVLLAGARHRAPTPLTVTPHTEVAVLDRGVALDPDARVAQLLAACRGGLWLTGHRHPAAPDGGDLHRLLDAYARLSQQSSAQALASLLDDMPPP